MKKGYFAVSREIFEHPLFADNRRLSRLEAWEWLIGHAAWKPRADRRRYGMVHLERGQLCGTMREIAGRWRWPKSNVHRFLIRLAGEAMISFKRTEPTSGPKTGTSLSYQLTLITICNYDRFQSALRGAVGKAGQQAGQQAGQRLQQAFALPEFLASEPTNHLTIESNEEAGGRRVNKPKPMHGAQSRDGKRIWYDYGTHDWQIFADDYREVREILLLPLSYIGGRGNWFLKLGEGTKRARRR